MEILVLAVTIGLAILTAALVRLCATLATTP